MLNFMKTTLMDKVYVPHLVLEIKNTFFPASFPKDLNTKLDFRAFHRHILKLHTFKMSLNLIIALESTC